MSWNLGASTSWNPQGLSRPVMGLLYFIFCIKVTKTLYQKLRPFSNIRFLYVDLTFTWQWFCAVRSHRNLHLQGESIFIWCLKDMRVLDVMVPVLLQLCRSALLPYWQTVFPYWLYTGCTRRSQPYFGRTFVGVFYIYTINQQMHIYKYVQSHAFIIIHRNVVGHSCCNNQVVL